MMAQERKHVEEAYAGDIIGIFDPGIFSIGDTLCKSKSRSVLPVFRLLHPSILPASVRSIR